MADINIIDWAATPRYARIRFANFALGSAAITLQALLGNSPILCNPLGFVGPAVLNIPTLPRAAEYFLIKYNFIAAQSATNTVLGSRSNIKTDLLFIEFNNSFGSASIDYDGKKMPDAFAFPACQKIMAISELRKITITNAAVSTASSVDSYQTTSAFAPDVVGATNILLLGVQVDVRAVF